MRQTLQTNKLSLFIKLFILFFPFMSFAEDHPKPHKENGEEVYEPKKEPDHPKKEEKHEVKTENKEKPHEEKTKDAHDPHAAEAKTTGHDEHTDKTKNTHDDANAKENASPKDTHQIENKDKETNSDKSKYKANKIVSIDDEDPYEVHKPLGIFWFVGVFIALLIVIFVFT